MQHEVVEARWNEEEGKWMLKICDRSTGLIVADWCHFFINGGGFLKCLKANSLHVRLLTLSSNWQWPDIKGLHSFGGILLHSAAWDQNASLKSQRVAVIGNGSSGIQLVTALQPCAPHERTLADQIAYWNSGWKINDIHKKPYLDFHDVGSRFRWPEWSQLQLYEPKRMQSASWNPLICVRHRKTETGVLRSSRQTTWIS